MKTQLSRQARERAFDFVWDTIERRYHDPAFNGIDWKAVGERYRPLALAAKDDAAFWDVLDRMTGELRDSHTRVETPRDVELRSLAMLVREPDTETVARLTILKRDFPGASLRAVPCPIPQAAPTAQAAQ